MNGLLTIQEVADTLNMSYTGVYKWIKQGKLKTLQAGRKGRHYIRREDLERLLQGANK